MMMMMMMMMMVRRRVRKRCMRARSEATPEDAFRSEALAQKYTHQCGFKIIDVLVGGIPTPPKNMKVSWDDDIPNIWTFIEFMFQTTNKKIINVS